MEEKLEAAIAEALDAKLGYYRQHDGTLEYEIFADYRDVMENRTAIEIFRSDEPMDAFWERMDEWYNDYEWELRTELENELRDELIDQSWEEAALEPLAYLQTGTATVWFG